MAVTTGPNTLEAAGLRPIPELDDARQVWPRGQRLRALREGAEAFKERFKAQGEVRGVRSVDLLVAPYPTTYAFDRAVTVPVPFIFITNRLVVVHYEDFHGQARTLVWEPSVPEGSIKAPFYAQRKALLDRLPGSAWLAENVFAEYYHDTDSAMRVCGVDPAEVDFTSFDHLHVQDPRMIVGTTTPMPGEREACAPLFPNALCLTQERELATLTDIHPMQWAWYVDGGLDGVPTDRIGVLQGSVELGVGVAIVWTPGHTDGNHSLVVNTPDGVWVSSENGVSLDNWQPELSKIPGVRKYSEFWGREVVMNANTLEDPQDQYDSMVVEKTLADPSPRDPRWRQVIPSSELMNTRRQWPIKPTHRHGGLHYGTLSA